jgi:hypothetical protein
MRGAKPTARRSPARTVAHLFARVANAVTAAWAGGDPIITHVQVAGSLSSDARSLSLSTGETKVIARRFNLIADHLQLSSR